MVFIFVMIGVLAQSPILIDWNVAARLSGPGLVNEKLWWILEESFIFFPNVFCTPGDGAFTSSSLSLSQPFSGRSFPFSSLLISHLKVWELFTRILQFWHFRQLMTPYVKCVSKPQKDRSKIRSKIVRLSGGSVLELEMRCHLRAGHSRIQRLAAETEAIGTVVETFPRELSWQNRRLTYNSYYKTLTYAFIY